jgi:ABC-type Fe3+/spermidine/putrescine transport system ATPase subunit
MDLAEELRRILRQEGTAALFVTHDQHDALSLSDRVAVMGKSNDSNSIIQIDSPENVYQLPINQEAAQLTGQAIFLPALALGRTAQSDFGTIALHREAEGAIDVLLRPNNLRFAAGKGMALVQACSYIGGQYQLILLCNGRHIRLYHPTALPIGSEGSIEIGSECWHWKLP